MIKNDDDYLKQRTYTNYGGVNMAFDLSDEELQATREMNKTAWIEDIDKWSREYLEERYKELVEIEKEHKKENGELREQNKELEIINKINPEKLKIMTDSFNEKVLDKFNEKYISKDKIKEIIQELEKQEDWYIENKSLDDLYGKIDILQELLEERN